MRILALVFSPLVLALSLSKMEDAASTAEHTPQLSSSKHGLTGKKSFSDEKSRDASLEKGGKNFTGLRKKHPALKKKQPASPLAQQKLEEDVDPIDSQLFLENILSGQIRQAAVSPRGKKEEAMQEYMGYPEEPEYAQKKGAAPLFTPSSYETLLGKSILAHRGPRRGAAKRKTLAKEEGKQNKQWESEKTEKTAAKLAAIESKLNMVLEKFTAFSEMVPKKEAKASEDTVSTFRSLRSGSKRKHNAPSRKPAPGRVGAGKRGAKLEDKSPGKRFALL